MEVIGGLMSHSYRMAEMPEPWRSQVHVALGERRRAEQDLVLAEVNERRVRDKLALAESEARELRVKVDAVTHQRDYYARVISEATNLFQAQRATIAVLRATLVEPKP